ncbi:hypothetical protein [Paenisporosarcina sp. NPDC076898]|uniref:hypothetical protein n=1 Tax=unclassified Paenisporosarcina TaxID=2642018 RepID=UPI003CFC7EA1
MDKKVHGVNEIYTDNYELTLRLDDIGKKSINDENFLMECIDYSVGRGFSRFVGSGEDFLIFSKPDYFDPDDMLITDTNFKSRVNELKNNKYPGLK